MCPEPWWSIHLKSYDSALNPNPRLRFTTVQLETNLSCLGKSHLRKAGTYNVGLVEEHTTAQMATLRKQRVHCTIRFTGAQSRRSYRRGRFLLDIAIWALQLPNNLYRPGQRSRAAANLLQTQAVSNGWRTSIPASNDASPMPALVRPRASGRMPARMFMPRMGEEHVGLS